MKTFEKLEDRHVRRADTVPVGRHRARDPRRAAALSVVPGLGQLYNGETGKGLLFLAASIANLVLFLMLFCTEPVMKGVIHIGANFHLTPSADMDRILHIVHGSNTVCVLYIGLSLSFMVYAMREAYDHAVELGKDRAFAPFFLGLSEATSGSFLAHFAFLCAGIIMVAFYAAPEPPREQATEILLQRPDPPPEPPKPKEPEPPKPEKIPEPPKKQEVVKKEPPKKVAPPKPTPVAVAVPTKDPTPSPIVQSNEPAPEAAPAAPTTADTGGSPGGTGQGTDGGGGGGDDVDFGSYLAEVQKRIKKNWFPPRGPETKSVTLKFKVRRDGTVGAIKKVSSSGVAMVDDAAITAVKNASPYPPLPPNSPEEIDIKFTFDYNVFNGRGGN